MDSTLFEEIQRTLDAEGPAAAIRSLCAKLREKKDYASLFYALLMQKRQQLGVIPSRRDRLPIAGKHARRLRGSHPSGRPTGRQSVSAGGPAPQAWAYFRMLNEPEPVRRPWRRISRKRTRTAIAGADRVLRGRASAQGFRLDSQSLRPVQRHHDAGQSGTAASAGVRQYCIGAGPRPVRRAARPARRRDRAPRRQSRPTRRPTNVRELIAGRDWLFADDFYHIDISHLSSVVQMSMHLTPCAELEMARELCEYGQICPAASSIRAIRRSRTSIAHRHLSGDPGRRQCRGGAGLFPRQAEQADPETVGTYPAQVLVNLLLRLERASRGAGGGAEVSGHGR